MMNYKKLITPDWYVCCECGRSACKLWRNVNNSNISQVVYCIWCVCEIKNITLKNINFDGTVSYMVSDSEYTELNTDIIYEYIPAIPNIDSSDYFYYGVEIPQANIWWRNLSNY